MSVTPTYPGVYIAELPSGTRTITGVATSIAAFIGTTSRGPVDKPTRITGFADFQRVFGGLWRGSGLGHAVRDFFLNGGSEALVVRIVGEGAVPSAWTLGDLVLKAAGPGAWSSGITVSVTHPVTTDSEPDADAMDVAAGQGVDVDDLFTLTITAGTATETHHNVTVVDGPRRLDRVLHDSRYLRVSGSLPDTRPDEQDQAAATTAGSDGAQPGRSAYVGEEATQTGMYALLQADLFNLLCIPDAAELDPPLWSEAAAFCLAHRAFLIIDPPADKTDPAGLTAWVRELALGSAAARNAAVYFPRVLRPDPLRPGPSSDEPACGAIAGTFARIDAGRGVWKAPAGVDAGLAGITGLAVTVTDGVNGSLNPIGINCLRVFPNTGPVIWGARTRRGADVLADDYKYVPVRRLALFLEETLFRGTQWVVFEPNDEPLWSQIRASVGTFMQDLFRRGAFQGSTPRDAYFVQCGKDTTTQYDIDRGIVNILVGFAPLKPAEFVMISIQQKTAAPA